MAHQVFQGQPRRHHRCDLGRPGHRMPRSGPATAPEICLTRTDVAPRSSLLASFLAGVWAEIYLCDVRCMAGGAIYGYSSAQLVLSGPEFCNNSVVSAVLHSTVLHGLGERTVWIFLFCWFISFSCFTLSLLSCFARD